MLIVASDHHCRAAGDKVQGFVLDSHVWLIADNIPQGKELAVLLHELGVHIGLEKVLGRENYAKLTRQLYAWADSGANTLEAQLARAAVARAESSSSKNKQGELSTKSTHCPLERHRDAGMGGQTLDVQDQRRLH